MNSNSENNDEGVTSGYHDHLEALRQLSFFAKLSLESQKIFAYLCAEEFYKKGDYLFTQGDNDGQGIFFLSGTAELYRETENTNIPIRNYTSEMFIGGLSLMGDISWHFSLQAVTDVKCLVMTKEKFSRAMLQLPDLMPVMVKAIAENISTWEELFLKGHIEESKAEIKHSGVSLY